MYLHNSAYIDLGANYSFTKDAFRDNPNIRIKVPGEADISYYLKQQESGEPKVRGEIVEQLSKAKKLVCKYRINSDRMRSLCK